MTEAFTDLTDDSTDEGTFPSEETQTDSDGTQTDSEESVVAFADDVRSTLPQSDSIRNEDRYESDDGGEKADDTDPRGLFRQPSLNEIRYYAREGPYGKTIIRKPIRDAFKHGFEIVGDKTEPKADEPEGSDVVQTTPEERGKIKQTLDQHVVDTYKEAKIKSRRDGLCVMMHSIADAAGSVSEPIETDSGSFEGFKLWTVDNLDDGVTAHEAADYTEYDPEQLYVAEGEENGGVVIVDDINSPDHGKVVGYGVREREDSDNLHETTFVHADRCHHFVHGEYVDGPLGNTVTGKHVGESVLTPVLQPLKAAQMGFWSITNILSRYSAPLHAVEPPESWSYEDYDKAEERMSNISAASDSILPPGTSLTVAEGVSEFDPEPYFETLVKAMCGGTVFTKSILEGTQSGTVSGSETDVKSYFSEVNVLREQDIETDLRAIAKKISSYDQSQIPRVAAVESVEFDWGPLFKINRLEQAEGAVSMVTAATNAVKNYALTPDEARSLLSEEWATFDIDVTLDELSEDQMDTLDRINLNEAGQGIKDNEAVNRETPQTSGSQGGRPAGSTGGSSTPTTADSRHGDGTEDSSEHPTTDSLDELTTEELQAELERREDSE